MEKCVADLMAKPDMKSKYPNAKERKSHAVAICHDSVMGKKTDKLDLLINLNKREGVNKMSKKTKKAKELEKVDEVKEEAKVEEAKVEETEEVEEAKVEEPKTEEVKEETEEVEAEEETEEKVEETETEEESEEEADKVEKVEEKGEAPKQGPVKEIEVKPINPEAEVKKADFEKLFSAVETLSDNVSKLADLVKKASTEEASKVKAETPIKVEEKIEKIEKTEEAKVEEKKTDTPSTEASGKLLKVLNDVKTRLEKLEKMPEIAKVVVSKTFVGDDEGQLDLNKIQSRLDEIQKIRESNPQAYTEKLMVEAYNLVKQKKTLGGR